jgi:anaerobic selenocysteine-containing dehydrogenase
MLRERRRVQSEQFSTALPSSLICAFERVSWEEALLDLASEVWMGAKVECATRHEYCSRGGEEWKKNHQKKELDGQKVLSINQ